MHDLSISLSRYNPIKVSTLFWEDVDTDGGSGAPMLLIVGVR